MWVSDYLAHFSLSPFPQPDNPDVLGTSGNLLLNRSVSAKIVLTPNIPIFESVFKTIKALKDMMLKYAEKLK